MFVDFNKIDYLCEKVAVMNQTIQLSPEQNSIVDAVWTLIEHMDDTMKAALFRKLTFHGKSSKQKEHSSVVGHPWDNIPISKDIMNLTFSNRKDIPDDYDDILTKELQQKYQ